MLMFAKAFLVIVFFNSFESAVSSIKIPMKNMEVCEKEKEITVKKYEKAGVFSDYKLLEFSECVETE